MPNPRCNETSSMIEYWETERDGTRTQYHNHEVVYQLRPNGDQFWYKNNEYHRDDGPAKLYHDGTGIWYRNGKLHRDDGPAIVYGDNGGERWYQDGHLHRDNGPAVIANYHDVVEREWWVNGEMQHCVLLAPYTLMIHRNLYVDISRYPSIYRIDDSIYHIDDVDLALLRLSCSVWEVDCD